MIKFSQDGPPGGPKGGKPGGRQGGPPRGPTPMVGMMRMGVQMVMENVMPMVMPMIEEHEMKSQVYMTTEGDDCSSPPAKDQMMSCLDAMQIACKDVSKFKWIDSKFSPCSCLWTSEIHRLLLVTLFICAQIPMLWACIASPRCPEPVTCNSSQVAWSACCWT